MAPVLYKYCFLCLKDVQRRCRVWKEVFFCKIGIKNTPNVFPFLCKQSMFEFPPGINVAFCSELDGKRRTKGEGADILESE